jgi:hypothetical protein
MISAEPVAVVERDERHLAAAARLHAHLRDDAGDEHALLARREVGERRARDRAKLGGIRRERVARQVIADRGLSFVGARLGPLARRDERDGRAPSLLANSETCAACLRALRGVERNADRASKRRAPRVDRVEAPRAPAPRSRAG